MRRARQLRFAAAMALTLALGQGVAVAQPPVMAPDGPPADPNAAAGLERQVTLSPQEQLAQADGHLARMEQARSTVRRMLMDAREKRDVVKTLCLNDKLSQLDVAITSATERREALAAAVTRNDGDLGTHEFTILSVLRQRSDQLSTEAAQCIGEEIGTAGTSSVTPTIDKDLPEEDPSEYPTFKLVVEPPMCASCYN